MQVYNNQQECCGCTACMSICPCKAITMSVNEMGFAYPIVNDELCVKCGACVSVCQFHAVDTKEYQQKYFEVKAKDTLIRKRSRSGGVFFLIAERVIEENGVVYGVAKDGVKVKYGRAEVISDVIPMQGSKYVECAMDETYISVANDLKKQRKVLFSGTACKVAGLYGYLNKKNIDYREKLITMDIVCHGVPSYLLYSDYLQYLETKYHGKVKEFNFRDKQYGWNTHVETFLIKGKKRTSDLYSGLFYSNRFLRPSCGVCPFTSYDRTSDITIADFVGSERVNNSFNDNKGLSMIMVNTQLGEKYVSIISEKCDILPLEKENTVQPNLERPSIIASDKHLVCDYYQKKGFKSMLRKYGRGDLLHRLKWRLVDYPALKRNKKRWGL